MYVLDRDLLAFDARIDSKPIQVLATGELLLSRFGAKDMTEASLRSAYEQHRDELQALARNHIEMGWTEGGRRVSLTTRHTRLKVAISERLNAWPPGRALLDIAHPLLVRVIGPDAGEVVLAWDVDDDDAAIQLVSLEITDPSINASVDSDFHPNLVKDVSSLKVLLAHVWSLVLEERIRDLNLKSG